MSLDQWKKERTYRNFKKEGAIHPTAGRETENPLQTLPSQLSIKNLY